jgi:hypothetical protein
MVFRILSETFLKTSAGKAPTPVARPANVLAMIPIEMIDIKIPPCFLHFPINNFQEYLCLVSVHPERVDFGSGQGRSYFTTAGVVALRRGLQNCENAGLGRKMLFLDGH